MHAVVRQCRRVVTSVVPFALLLSVLVRCIAAPARAASPDEIRARIYLRYANVLAKYVSDEGLVSYAKLRADRRDLNSFLSIVALLPESTINGWTKDDRTAFWINVYNAMTLSAVLEGYPIESRYYTSLDYPKKSIRQIPGVLDRAVHRVAGSDLSLSSIEAKVHETAGDEPKVQFALAVAAKGGPPLRREPFEGAKLSLQLDDQVRQFLAKPDRFRIDRIAGVVLLSPFFDWNSARFIQKYGGGEGTRMPGLDLKARAALELIAQYLAVDDQAFLGSARIAVAYLGFDWSLNDVP